MNADDLITKLDGSAAVAKFLGIEQNTVGNWRKRGIPAWACPALKQMCDGAGVDAGSLLDPRQPQPNRRQSVAA